MQGFEPDPSIQSFMEINGFLDLHAAELAPQKGRCERFAPLRVGFHKDNARNASSDDKLLQTAMIDDHTRLVRSFSSQRAGDEAFELEVPVAIDQLPIQLACQIFPPEDHDPFY